MIYFSILILLLIIWLFNINNNVIELSNEVKHTYSQFIYVLLVSAFFSVFLGLRGLTGTDSVMYLSFYETGIYPENMEKVYMYISLFFSNHKLSFNMFQLFISTITILSVFIQYWKQSKNIYFTVFLFYLFTFYLYAFNVSRQTLAGAILTLAFLILQRGRLINYVVSLILCLIAIGIHRTSIYIIVALIIIGLLRKKLLQSYKIMIFVGGFNILVSLILYKTSYVYDHLLDISSNFGMYSSYIDGTSASGFLTNKSMITFIIAVISNLIIILYSQYPDSLRKERLFGPFFLFTIFNMFQVSWISDRMSLFVLPIIPLFFTNLVYIKGDVCVSKNKQSTMIFLILGMGLLMFTRIVIQNFGQIVPYMGPY